MDKNPAFRKKSFPVLFFGILMMYFFSGLQTDHLNVLTPYYTKLGWSATAITNPVTFACFVVIPATLLVGTLFLRYGVIKVVVPSTFIVGISVMALAFSGENQLAYDVSLFSVRLFILPLQMGGFMLCTNWFIKARGRALGLVTLGSPLCTASFIFFLTKGVSSLGFGKTYCLVGSSVLLLALGIGLFVKSSPEELGLNPDGALDCQITCAVAVNSKMSCKEVLGHKEAWFLIVSYGFLQFCISGIMSFYVVRLNMTGTAPSLYFFWLSIAAILGIPVSILFGFLDDTFGTIIASLVLCCTFFLSLTGLLLMGPNNKLLLIATAIGIAGVTGGTPTLHPSITSYVYGRARYQAANRWIMTIQAGIMAFAIFFMASILDATGSLVFAYKIMIGLVLIAMICLIIIGRKPDYDRSPLS